MEARAQQPWRSRDRRGDDPGDRTTRRGRVLGGDRGGVAGRPISSFSREAAIHTKSRWEAAAVGDTDGAGSSGTDGGEGPRGDPDRADLRGGFPVQQLWFSSEEDGHTGL